MQNAEQRMQNIAHTTVANKGGSGRREPVREAGAPTKHRGSAMQIAASHRNFLFGLVAEEVYRFEFGLAVFIRKIV